MEKKWIISVEEDALSKVSESLKEKDVQIIEILEAIGIIIIFPNKLKMNDVKKIDGVLSVEEERNNTI